MSFSEQGLTQQELLKTNKELANKIIELEQQKNTLEQYLRIEKEVSDETIKELEQQITELKESQKQKQIIRLCKRLDESKHQNEQMIEVLKESYKGFLNTQMYSHTDMIKQTIESVTGKPIDEATK